MTPYGMEYPFGQLGSAVLAASPPIFLCSPSLLAGGVGREAEEALILLSNKENIPVSSTL